MVESIRENEPLVEIALGHGVVGRDRHTVTSHALQEGRGAIIGRSACSARAPKEADDHEDGQQEKGNRTFHASRDRGFVPKRSGAGTIYEETEMKAASRPARRWVVTVNMAELSVCGDILGGGLRVRSIATDQCTYNH
jgi:hypothetical protein